MPTPNKPTKEELKAKEEEAIKAAEELEENPDLLKEEINPEEEARIEAEANTSEDSVIEEEETLQVEEEQAEPSEEKEALRAKLEAEKKKSAASARENQKIYAKNRIINKALVDADEISEPTEEELVKEFPEWDVMSDTERIFAKETVISRNWRKTIAQAKEQATKIEKWNE